MELVCAALFVGGPWGRYKFYESLVFLFFRISLMGMDKGVIWYYSQVEEAVYLKSIFRSLTWCFLAFMILGALTFGSYYGIIPFSGWVLGKNSDSFHVAGSELLQYLLVVPMMLIIELCLQANVNKYNLKYRILVPGILVPLVTYGLAVGGHFAAPGLFSLSLCLLAGNTAGAALAFWGFVRTHRPSWQDVSLGKPPSWKMIQYSFPLASANIFAALAVRADIFMLAGLAGVRSVEIFAVVTMIGKSLTSIRQSFENILLSAFSSSKSSHLTLKLKHYFNYSVWLVMGVQGALLLLMIFFGTEALGLINSQYATGYWTLIITAFFIYVNTATEFSALLLLGLGRTYVMPVNHVIFFVGNILLNFLFIPRWDSLGAALALGLTNLASGFIYFSFLTYFNRSTPFLWSYWRPILINTGCLVAFTTLGFYLHVGFLMRVFVFALSLAGAFFWQRRHYRQFNNWIKDVGNAPA